MVHDNRARRLIARLRPRRDEEERGAVLVMTAVFMVMLLAFAALVIDLGNARQQRRQMKAAADAAAIAGVEEIATIGGSFTGSSTQWAQVVAQVRGYAQQNFGVPASAWATCTDAGALAYRPDIAAGNSCISADMAAWPGTSSGSSVVNRLRVRIPTREVHAIFGAAVDTDSLEVNAVSTAAVTRTKQTITHEVTETVAGAPCALCVLGTNLAFDGQNGDLSVTGGNVVVNSNPATGYAATIASNGHLRTLDGYLIGGPGAPGKWSGTGFVPAPTTLGSVADPLAGIQQCNPSLCPNDSRSASATTLDPGVYQGISGSHRLNPGIYVLTGDVVLSGNDLLQGDGVMLYFACSNYPEPCSTNSTRAGAKIRATGNGAIRLTPPTTNTCTVRPLTCPYKGLTIFADRDNASLTTIRGNGTNENGGTSGTKGTIYLKSGTLDLRGNGFTLSSLVVVNTVALNGNPAGVTIAYDQSINVPASHTVTSTTTTEAFSYDASGLNA